jgi:hypothetical protein
MKKNIVLLTLLSLIVLAYSTDSIADSVPHKTDDSISFSPKLTGNRELVVPDTLKKIIKNNPVFNLVISETGAIEEISLLRGSGYAAIDSLLVSQLRSCSFPPATKNGEPVAVRVQWEYRVSLPDQNRNNAHPLKADTLFQKNEIVVYGIEQSETPRQSLGKIQIARFPGYSGDPVKMLEILPSLSQTASLVIYSSALCVRGGGPDDSRYVIDGIPLLKLNHISGLISLYNAEGLQSVDFFPGDFGVRYGGAVSGVINMITDTLIPEKRAGYADLSLLDGAAVYKSALPGKSSLFLSLRRSWIGDVAPLASMDEEYWRIYFGDMNLRFSIQPTPTTRFTVHCIGATLSNKRRETIPVYITPWDSLYYNLFNPAWYPDTASYLMAIGNYGAIDSIVSRDARFGYQFLLPALKLRVLLAEKWQTCSRFRQFRRNLLQRALIRYYQEPGRLACFVGMS